MSAQQEQRKRPVAGGYSEISPPNDHPRLSAVTDYVLEHLSKENPYSFADPLLLWKKHETDVDYRLEIVQASQQVVAGMNYRLMLVLVRCDCNNGTDTALGAFHVTVYDKFGTLANIQWGKEVPLEQARNIQSTGTSGS